MLDVFTSQEQELVSFVKACSKDDLTIFSNIHGIEIEIPLFEAILQHHALDRSTALTIFHNCNPAFYEKELAAGRNEDELAYEREDAIFLEILEMAHRRLTRGPALSSKFAAPCLKEWARFPHVSPAGFKRWRLTDAALAETDGLQAKPTVRYDSSKIRLVFDVWKYRN